MPRPPSRASALLGHRALLALGLVLTLALAIALGPSRLPLAHLPGLLFGGEGLPEHERVIFWSLRLPRALLAIVVGGALGAGGAAAQGLFRNPLADPGLIGVSSGATLGAALSIVAAAGLGLPALTRGGAVPLAAFAGASLATVLVVRLGGGASRGATATVLLAGIAINALVGATVGLLSYLASDAELRNLTFWTLGGLGGASWSKLAFALPFAIASLALLLRAARRLDVFALGELDAALIGVDVAALRREIVVALALGVGAAVSAAGLIGFVGLVVPHLMRLGGGPRHSALIPRSWALGAILVTLADTLARTVAAPLELPVGLFTAAVGAPFFLHLLRREVRR